jgi:hypothetical protein
LKQWREKESRQIDNCQMDIDLLLKGMETVKLGLTTHEKNLRIDACERDLNKIH